MPVRKVYNKLFCIAIVMIFSITMGYAQQNDSTKSFRYKYDCADRYIKAIQAAIDSGYYKLLDNLYLDYLNSPCFKVRDTLNPYQEVKLLNLMRQQRIADGYRKDEADGFKKMIDSIERKIDDRNNQDVIYRIFRIGMAGTINLSRIGKNGEGFDLVMGIHPEVIERVSVGLDIGVFWQGLPFSINTVKNKDVNNNYVTNGYMFNANGKITVTGFQARMSVNIEPAEYAPWGGGVFIGYRWSYFNKIKVTDSYFEYNYTNNSGPGNVSYVSYSKEDSTQYNDNSFFTHRSYSHLMLGAVGYYMPAKRFLFYFEPIYNINVGNRMRVNKTGHTIRANCWSLGFGILLLLEK
jgi:hypothetical protein